MKKELSRLVRYDVYRGSKISILVRQPDRSEDPVYCVRLQGLGRYGRRHYVCSDTLYRLFKMHEITMPTNETQEVLEEPDECGYIQ